MCWLLDNMTYTHEYVVPTQPIHAIYYEEDPVPRLMKVLDLPCSTLGRDNTEAGLQIKVNELPKSVSIQSCLLWCCI